MLACLLTYLLTYLITYLFIYLFVYLFVYLFLYLFVCLFVYLFIYLAGLQCFHILLCPFNNYIIFFLQLLLSFQSSSINPFSPISPLIPSAQVSFCLPRIGLLIHIIIYRSCIGILPNMCPILTHFKSVFREPLPLGKEISVVFCNYSNTTECKIYYFLKLEKSSTNRTTNKYYGILERTLAVT